MRPATIATLGPISEKHTAGGANNLVFVKETAFTTAASVSTAAITPANTAGNLLVLCSSLSGISTPVISTVADTGGNTWTKATSATTSTTTGEMWYSKTSAIGGTLTVTYNSAGGPVLSCLEFSGANATPLDQIKGLAQSTTTIATGTSPTTTTAAQVVVAFVGSNGNPTFSAPTSGYTALTQHNTATASHLQAIQSAYEIINATGTQAFQVTSTLGVASEAILATFKSS